LSVAAYNLENRWSIPAVVWPGVVGLSFALHASVLVFGLPNLSWNVPEPDSLSETEILFESGGPLFQQAETLEPSTLVPEELPASEIAEPLAPQSEELLASDASNVPPLESSPIEQIPVQPEDITEALPVLPEAAVAEATPIETQELAALPVEEVQTGAATAAEEVTAVEPELAAAAPLASIDAQTVDQAVVQAPLEALEPAAPAAEPDGAVIVSEASDILALQASPPEAPVIVPAEAVPSLGEPASNVVTAETAVTEVDTVSEIIPAEQIGNGPAATLPDSAQILAVPADSTDAVVIAPSASEIVPLAPTNLVPAASLQDSETVVAVPSETVTLTPIDTTAVEIVSPVSEQLTAVEPEETVVAALSPSEPDTAALPSVDPEPAPANVVAPVAVASIDPLAKVTSYVENYDFGECAHLSVLAAGADSAQVTAFGVGIGPFAQFDQRFTADQGYEASIQVRLVTTRQCALLNALGVSQGLEAAGLVELDKTVVKSGTQATGLIQRDLPIARIAAAEAAGLDLGGKGPPELYLIDDAGQIHDARDFLLPASNAQTAGGWRFKVPVVLMSRSQAETALVLAIWNRPKAKQPPRFGTLPASRIAGLLEAPGVYSLAAFKVSR